MSFPAGRAVERDGEHVLTSGRVAAVMAVDMFSRLLARVQAAEAKEETEKRR
jgi:tRNA G37 N-methylase TrmD